MSAIQIPDLNNGKTDVDFIAEFVNSTAPTAVDRFGRTRRTVKGVEIVLDAKVVEVDGIKDDAIVAIEEKVNNVEGVVVEAVNAAVGVTAESAAALEASRIEYEDRVYPGVYSSPPSNKPRSGLPSADGDRCTIMVGGVAYEHLRTGGGWLIPNIDAAQLQLASGSTRVGATHQANPAPAFLQTVSDMLNGYPIPLKVFLPDDKKVAVRDFTSTWAAHEHVQKGIQAVLYDGKSSQLLLGEGLLNAEEPIHTGYGESFKQLTIEGAGSAYRGATAFRGTIIKSRRSDRPGLVGQGGRRTRLRKFALLGLAANHIETNDLGGLTTAVDDTDISAWIDPALHANATSRYAPYAGIAIDPYSGPAPAVAYPPVNYPLSLGPLAQYNKSPSSNVELDDVFICGFFVGLAIQPCDYDGNGDFVSLWNTVIQSCAVGVSVGNSQARCFNMHGGEIAQVHTGFTNLLNGKQIGKLGGDIVGVSFGRLIRLLDLLTSFSGPVTFSSCVSELMWSFGNTGPAGSATYPIVSSDSEWNLTGGSARRGRPAQIIQGATPITFRGGTLRVDSAVTANAKLDGVSIVSTDAATRDLSQRVTGGLLPLGSNIVEDRSPGARINTAAGAVELSQFQKTSGRTRPLHRMARVNVWSESAADSPGVGVPRIIAVFTKTLGVMTISGLTGTMDLTSAGSGRLPFGIRAGDAIQDSITGTQLLVESNVGLVATFRALNNYRNPGSGNELREAISAVLGDWYVVCGRLYGTSYPLYGDFTTGSNVITNIGRADGTAGFARSEIADGDYLWQNGWGLYYFNSISTVTAIDTTAKTITMSSNANRTQTRVLLPFWVRG